MIISGCATFSKKEFRSRFLKVELSNRNQFNGKYSFYAKRSLGLMIHDSIMNKINLYQEIVNEPQGIHDVVLQNLDDEKDYFVKIEWYHQDSVLIALYEEDQMIRDTALSGIWKKGVFYMDNRFLECNGIPYLLGGCNHNKRRLVFTSESNLIVNTAVSNEGAFLFLIGSGYRMNRYIEFEKLN
ncbi:hypothetical protein KFE94_15475 [bacterium SCSIO 12643]|nr:hypothetical protein KFE94_15475 [bacterium SCSIO 12643]